jgi:hypothetical protein
MIWRESKGIAVERVNYLYYETMSRTVHQPDYVRVRVPGTRIYLYIPVRSCYND